MIIAVIAGLVLGCGLTLIAMKGKIKQCVEYDQQTAEQNDKLRTELIQLEAQRVEASKSIEAMKENAQKQADAFYKEKIQIATAEYKQKVAELELQYKDVEGTTQDSFERVLEKQRQHFYEAEAEYKKEYEDMLAENVNEFSKKIAELEELDKKIEELRSAEQSAVLAAKRAEEIRTQADFYKLQLSETDLEEIKILRNVAPYLRDKEPLNKVIWKCYYEKPTTDLIGRVIGSGAHTGIYKITNLQNGMCYVGQAANLADRWKQHIKRGIGAEAPTRNKLYPAMLAVGVENFSFEVVEECERARLDEREDYWQDYFEAKTFGYSIK